MNKSPRTNLQSLRDNLLKATAIHFEQIFLDEDVILGYVLKDGILLPPHLFEDIQSKGNEIGWPIPAQFLKPCFAFREALNWANVLLIKHDAGDLMELLKGDLPIKQLSFCLQFVTPEIVSLIRAASPNLEYLSLGFYYTGDDLRHKEILETMENPLIFPKLKKLLIDFNVISAYTLIYIDFTCCANTLESMSLKHLKKLHNLTIIQLQYEPLWESLKEIKTLRSLNLPNLQIVSNELFTILDNFPNLQCLDYSYVDEILYLSSSDVERIKSKNLKYFGYLSISKQLNLDIEPLAQQVGSRKDMDSILTHFEYSAYMAYFMGKSRFYAIEILNSCHVTNSQWCILEKAILTSIQDFLSNHISLYECSKIFEFALASNYQWSPEFLKKISNLVTNYALYRRDVLRCVRRFDYFIWILDLTRFSQILNFILSYITDKPSTKTAVCYLKYLMLNNMYQNFGIRRKEFVKVPPNVEVPSIKYYKIQT